MPNFLSKQTTGRKLHYLNSFISTLWGSGAIFTTLFAEIIVLAGTERISTFCGGCWGLAVGVLVATGRSV
jgi:hypothetical protein